MAKLLEILRYPDSRLRRKCTPVSDFDPSVRRLAQDMLKTMYHAHGIGLAAAQVGVTKRVIVVDIEQRPGTSLILVNPEITASAGSQQIEEGCLSVPNIHAKVKRAATIDVDYQTPEAKERTMKFSGLEAICIQHEIDHLDGRLFVDYLSPLKKVQVWMRARKYPVAQTSQIDL